MTRDKDKYREREELLDHLFEALSEEEDIDTVQRALASSGVDVEKTVAHGQELISSFLKRQKLVRGRAKYERIKKALADFRGGLTESVEEARDAIARAIAGESTGRGYQVAHRKLESIEKEDLESLKDDAAILEFIARFGEGDEEKE